VVAAFEAVQARYFAHSQEVTKDVWKRRSPLRRVAQNTARLADSLL
jgi:hypothetical protein